MGWNSIVTCNVRAHTQAEDSDAPCVELGRRKTHKREIRRKSRTPLLSIRSDVKRVSVKSGGRVGRPFRRVGLTYNT
jgi:hypothetical protein